MCKHLGCWSHNSNDGKPACDRVATIPVRCTMAPTVPLLGLGALIEAKECRFPKFEFYRLSQNERAELDDHFVRGNGLSILLFKLVCARPRVFGCLWEDWLELESEMGYHDSPGGGRRRAGSASISLLDGERPYTLVELDKVERPKGLGWTWDLSCFIPEGFELDRK